VTDAIGVIQAEAAPKLRDGDPDVDRRADLTAGRY